MNLSLKVLHHLNNFIVKNPSVFENKESFKEEHPVVEQLSKKVFGIIFGNNINNIKFDLKNHFRYIDKQSWSEIKGFSDLNPRLKLTKNNLEEKVKTLVYFGLLEILLINRKGAKTEELEGKERSYFFSRLLNENRFIDLFKNQRCRSCDTDFKFEFDYLKKEFTVNENIEYCPCTKHKMKFSLDFPSKELVFINDIRHIFQAKRKDPYEHSNASIYGKILECKEYLKHNIAYISLSSGSINVLHSKKEKMVVLDFDMDTYYKSPEKNENEDRSNKEPLDSFEKEGKFDLELWGVFMMDKKTYQKMCKKADVSLGCYDTVNVKVKGTKIEVDYDLDELLVEIKYS